MLIPCHPLAVKARFMLEPVRNYMRLKNEMKGYYTPGAEAAPVGYVFVSLEDFPSSAEESEMQRETHEKLLGTVALGV